MCLPQNRAIARAQRSLVPPAEYPITNLIVLPL